MRQELFRRYTQDGHAEQITRAPKTCVFL